MEDLTGWTALRQHDSQAELNQPTLAVIALDYYSDTNKALAPFHSGGHAWSGRNQDCAPVLPNMHVLKLIFERIGGLVQLACRLPSSVALALKQRRRQFALNVLEAERLDRIRNPSKYLGK
jgi:hypothetical protein